MKKLWCTIFAILACNIISLFVMTSNEETYATQQNTCCISQQDNCLTLNNDSNITLLEQPESVAVVNSRTEVVESNTSAKNDSSGNSKFNHNDQRKHCSKHQAEVVAYNYASIGFSRAIDHYIYAFRHIII